MSYGVKRHTERSVWDAALDRVNRAYDLYDHIVVSFSGGKDSTAVLNIALKVAEARGALPLHVIFFDEEVIPDETVDYVRRVAERPDVRLDWYCVPVAHANAASTVDTTYWAWAPEAEHLWVRPLPPEGIIAVDGFPMEPPSARLTILETVGLIFPTDRTIGMLMGIRADESIIRYRAVSSKRTDNFIQAHPVGNVRNLFKVYPIYDWTTEDVWTAPARFGWDYNEYYDVLEMAGISHSQQRAAPPFGHEPIASIAQYKECFPELWAKMAERVHGAPAAGRYARTALYATEDVLLPTDGTTYPEYIRALIVENHVDLDQRAHTAGMVRQFARSHVRKVGAREPILDRVPHPETGVTWKWLARMAQRGNFKNRMQPPVTSRSNVESRESARRKYDAALEDAREEGREADLIAWTRELIR